MNESFFKKRYLWICLFSLNLPSFVFSQEKHIAAKGIAGYNSYFILLFLMVLLVFLASLYLFVKVKFFLAETRKKQLDSNKTAVLKYLCNMNREQVVQLLQYKKTQTTESVGKRIPKSAIVFAGILLMSLLSAHPVIAQATSKEGGLLSEGGIIITITLIMIPVLFLIVLMIMKLSSLFRKQQRKHDIDKAKELADYLADLPQWELVHILEKRKKALDFSLTNNELAGGTEAFDKRGIINNIDTDATLAFVTAKKKAVSRPTIDPQLAKLILWYFVTATFWLLLGTTIGEYIGIKFVSPDADHISWLSFGRLRPVHTNAVFWGWASLGMLGLGNYIVPRVSNVQLASIKRGWYALYLVNAAVVLGTIFLMAGINNGGGEYREYIWPVMLLFGLALILTLINFLQTIAKRTTKEIYVSNWYIVASIIFTITIAVVAYIPLWQDGLGETIIQGYYMHQGVGMWFMLFTLGIVYYMLPQQLNRPIYSYSLGILAFWTQILFYTLIGTHHFVFSSIPWWLQTIAIVGSAGMIIPVVAGTTNFIMTFKGSWHKIADSYTLPFFLVGTIFYCTGSLQGTAEAFRSTNLIWHFTDFTVAHSHLTMYGIISFFLWAGMYAVIPRFTGKEAPQVTIGAHFWMALVGLLFYTIPLMIGSTLRGQMWIEGKPFIETVTHMAPYWLWRAIGGSLMWLSHIFFAFNLYKMLSKEDEVDVNAEVIRQLEVKLSVNH